MNDDKITEISKIAKDLQEKKVKKPDEAPSLHIEAKIRIFDPETDKTIFEGRA